MRVREGTGGNECGCGNRIVGEGWVSELFFIPAKDSNVERTNTGLICGVF